MFAEFTDDNGDKIQSLDKQDFLFKDPKSDPERNRLIDQNKSVGDTSDIFGTISVFDIFNLGILGLCNNIRVFEMLLDQHPIKHGRSGRKIVNFQCHKIFFENKLCHLFTIRDVTKQTLFKNVQRDNENLKIFAASVSHEMLNPLKCIITFANQLGKPGCDLNRSQICNMISCSARLLQCHTQDLLD